MNLNTANLLNRICDQLERKQMPTVSQAEITELRWEATKVIGAADLERRQRWDEGNGPGR